MQKEQRWRRQRLICALYELSVRSYYSLDGHFDQLEAGSDTVSESDLRGWAIA
jgi:hypothetical protein